MNDLSSLRAPYEETVAAGDVQVASARRALASAMTDEHTAPLFTRRRRLAPRLVGVLAAGSLATLLVGLLIATPDTPPSPPAAPPAQPTTIPEALGQLRAAPTGATERLAGPDEFSYIRTTQPTLPVQTRSLSHNGRTFRVTSTTIGDEVWSSAGRLRIRGFVEWTPATERDAAQWEAAGSPDLAALARARNDDADDAVQTSSQSSATSYIMNNGPVDLTAFAGNPDGMVAALREGFRGSGPDPNTELFVILGDVLTGAAQMPADVRRTLFEVLLTEVRGLSIDPDPTITAGLLLTLDRPGIETQGLYVDLVKAQATGRHNRDAASGKETIGLIVERGITPSIDQRPDGTNVPIDDRD